MTAPKIDLARFDLMAAAGLVVSCRWGNGSPNKTACTLGAAVGVTNMAECVAQGWPKWLAEIVTQLADGLPSDELWLGRQREILVAIQAADPAALVVDGPVFCAMRRNILQPIARTSGAAQDAESAWVADAAQAASEAAHVLIYEALLSALEGIK